MMALVFSEIERAQTFWTLTFELLDRNIALLHFQTQRVAETALRESLFWATSSRFRGTWRIFSSSGDCKLLPEGLALQWNGHSISFWRLTFELLDQNIQPRHFKTKRVAETALTRIVILTNFGSIFRNLGDILIVPETVNYLLMWFGSRWNGQSKTFWTFTFQLLGRNIAPVHFKNQRVAETALRASWFWQNSARFPRTWPILSSPEQSKLTPDGLGLQWNEQGNSFWTLIFQLLGWNIAPLHFKTERGGETALRASWFWANFRSIF